MNSCVKKSLINVGRGLLMFFSALCALGFLALIVIRSVALDRDLFVSAAEDPAYNDQLLTAMSDRLEAECLFYGIDFPYVKSCLTEETITQKSKEYIGALYDAISTGKVAEETLITEELFLPGVNRFFASLGEYGNKIGSETRFEIAQSLANVANETMRTVPYSEKATQLYSYTYGNPVISHVSTVLWALGIAAVAFLTIAFILNRKRPVLFSQRAIGAWWCAAAVCYLPIALLHLADLPSKLALNGTLKALATALLNNLFARTELLFGIVFWVLTSLLLSLSALLLIRQYRSLSTQTETPV